ncbi:hypothetical protein RN001_015998 [Aquatica leii]|uniref:Uncharacterized protein n=1 Tax=Aquatica leii TaxID=1421715 RepID=A0AAN7SB56_9COLE|nr:hypothetical protein RN001_015998 [Aquatica leii]
MINTKPDVDYLLELVIGVEAGLDNIGSIISDAEKNHETDDENLEMLKSMLVQVEVEFKQAVDKLEQIVDPDKPKDNTSSLCKILQIA